MSSGQHYETMVLLGPLWVTCCTSRAQLNSIFLAAEECIDDMVEDYLKTSLPYTLLSPHFCTSADKSIINRVTNQAVVLTFVVAGVRDRIGHISFYS